MKQIPINVPVFIQDFKSQDNGRYSTAKLKVFYQGETADHRLFTKKFSDEVIKTLPSTPVVAFYSEDDEDFIGHNSTQYAYGHVPETATIEWEEDEKTGNKFVITDVILYTGRKDNIGEVARKIVGKQHSLELNPDTLKYKINRDNNGNFLNIEFITGEFIGLSVLGDNETPAFTGSGFFSSGMDYDTFAAECRDRFDKFLNYLNNSGGKIQVFNSEEFFSKAGEFLAKTMQEYQADIYAALEAMGIYGFIEENTTEYVVIYQYNKEIDMVGHYRYSISEENGKMSLTNPVPVRARFLTDEQAELLDSNGANCATNEPAKNDDEEDKKKEEPAFTSEGNNEGNCVKPEEDDKKGECAAEDDDKDKKDKDNDQDPAPPASEDDDKKKEESNADCKSDTEEKEDDKQGAEDDTTPQKEEEKDKDKVGTATASASATALSDEERAELAGYRKAAKIAIIDSYAADLDESTLDKYKENVDNFTSDELEAKLAIEYRNFVKNNKNNNDVQTIRNITTYTTITTAEAYNENDPADVVKKYKRN